MPNWSSQTLATDTSKQRLNKEARAVLLRIGPEFTEDNLRELT